MNRSVRIERRGKSMSPRRFVMFTNSKFVRCVLTPIGRALPWVAWELDFDVRITEDDIAEDLAFPGEVSSRWPR